MAGNQGKRVQSPAQIAALARGRANRQANIKAGRASHARQAASSQTRKLVALASQPEAAVDRQPEAADEQDDVAQVPAGDPSPRDSGTFSSASKPQRLSQAEQDALLFKFDMGDGEAPQGVVKQPTGAPAGKQGLGAKVKGLLTNTAPKDKLGGITDKEEEDAQQAAAQWTELASVAFLFLGARLFGDDLKPTNEMAQAMAAPLCRIAMRHIAPLRTASADTYDIVAFMTACLVYYSAIEPALKAKRSERLVVNATVAQPAGAQVQRDAAGSNPGSGSNVVSIAPDTAGGRRRRDEASPDYRSQGVRGDEFGGQSAASYAGADVIAEASGIQI